MYTTLLSHQRMQQTNEESPRQAEVADLLFAYTTLQGLLTLYATSPVSHVLPWLVAGQHVQNTFVLAREVLSEQGRPLSLQKGITSEMLADLLTAILEAVDQVQLDSVLRHVEGGQLFLAALSQAREAHMRLAPLPAPVQTEPAEDYAGEQELFLDDPSWWDRCMQWQPRPLTAAHYLALSMLTVVSLVLAVGHSLLALLAAHALLLLCCVVFHQANKLAAGNAPSSRTPALRRSMPHLLLQVSLVLILPSLIGLGTSTFAVVPLVPLIAIIWRLWQGEEVQRPAPPYAVIQIIGTTEEGPETEDCWGNR